MGTRGTLPYAVDPPQPLDQFADFHSFDKVDILCKFPSHPLTNFTHSHSPFLDTEITRTRLSRVVVVCHIIEVVHVYVATLLGTESRADIFGVDCEFFIHLLSLEHSSTDGLQRHQEWIKSEVCCLHFMYFQA